MSLSRAVTFVLLPADQPRGECSAMDPWCRAIGSRTEPVAETVLGLIQERPHRASCAESGDTPSLVTSPVTPRVQNPHHGISRRPSTRSCWR